MTLSRRSPIKYALLVSTLLAISLLAAGGVARRPTTTATTRSSGVQKVTSSTSASVYSTSKSISASFSASSQSNTAIPTYPAPSVPPTQNAPFMNQSSLPDGTVFIAVGAILGAFGLALLAWRAIMACLLHRSVEQAALAQHGANDKIAPFAPASALHKYTNLGSSPSLIATAASERGVRRTNRGPISSSTPSTTNLFFSPTAAAAGGAGAAHRESRHLPSGFYAAGVAVAPVPGVHGHRGTASVNLSNLRPSSRGHSGSTPPDSPSSGSRQTPVPHNFSTSSINLNRPSSQRAPSAYLNDLLADNPDMFPPAGGSAGHHHRQTQGLTK